MNYQNLSLAFKRINTELPLLPYLQEICDGIAVGQTDKKEVDKILIGCGVHRSIATVDLLHLIFAYIKIALEDEMLTQEEKDNIRFLKTLFHIQPGDFYYHNKLDVEKTILIVNKLIFVIRVKVDFHKQFLLGVTLRVRSGFPQYMVLCCNPLLEKKVYPFHIQ